MRFDSTVEGGSGGEGEEGEGAGTFGDAVAVVDYGGVDEGCEEGEAEGGKC